jgi:uncharacterized protein YndB with AHSA1/START domain
MATTEQTFTTAAQELFDAVVDPDTYPHWLVGARKIRSVSDDWPSPDSFFEHTVGFGPIVIPDTTSVIAIDPPRMLELLVRARPAVEAVVRFEVESTPSGCTLRMTETPAGVYKMISAVAQPLIRARNERSLKRLKKYLESGASVRAA